MLATNGSHNASESSLTSKLAHALPRDVHITLHHVSSNPTPSAAIFAAPPGSKPEKTLCESHFVTVSVTPSSTVEEILVYAIEVLIYTTEHLTTLFVSKADSTGYSRLIETPRGSPSLLKTISSTFISHLVVTRQRPGVKLVVSLFARAQDQYLFPGSIENSSKHVLDDRGLVRWWSGVLDSVLRQHVKATSEHNGEDGNGDPEDATQVKGYLVVPGCDKHETQSFLAPSAKTDPPDRKRWSNSHPLRQLATNPDVPPRCLIPHFPDDPKARFLDELDDELPDSQASQNNPAKRSNTGQWKSVKTMEQFWELMAFRQECSSGRLVGFLWVVFPPPELHSHTSNLLNGGSQVSTSLAEHHPSPPTPPTKPPPKKRLLTGPIRPRPPRTKPHPTTTPSLTTTPSSPAKQQPATTKYYHWPPSHRGQLVLSAKNYHRAIDVLLRLDFAGRNVAENSTRRWVDEVGVIAGTGTGTCCWGEVIVGMRVCEGRAGSERGDVRSDCLAGRKRTSAEVDVQAGAGEARLLVGPVSGGEGSLEARKGSVGLDVNVLSEGLVRKKKKKLQP